MTYAEQIKDMNPLDKARARVARIAALEAETVALIASGHEYVSPKGCPWPRPLSDVLNWQRHALAESRKALAALETA